MKTVTLCILFICLPFIFFGQCAEGESELDINIQFANYSYEISFELTSNSQIISNESFNSSNNYNLEVFTECLTPGEYTFTMNDSYGDGLCESECCFYCTGNNDGSISLFLNGSIIFYDSGNWGDETGTT